MNRDGQLLKNILQLLILVSFGTGTAWAQQAPDSQHLSTLSYRPAVALQANQATIQIGSHTTTRCYDWDQDGDMDLLAGGGDGRPAIEEVTTPVTG